MKRSLFLLCLFFALAAQAQIEVSEFYIVGNDLSAREERDVDGELYSIIKIRTESPNLNLNEITARAWSQLGSKTVTKEQKGHVVEIWVYVRYGETGLKLFYRNSTKEVKFNNLQPGTNIGKGEVYIMQLRSMNDTDEPMQQYVMFVVEPKEALLSVDGEQILVDADGVASRYGYIGSKIQYKVECKNYHTQEGSVVVGKQKKEVNISLKPAFGTLLISGNDGATVYIDKENKGRSPMTIEGVSSGSHTIQIVKPKYKTWSGTVNVRDEETTTVSPELEPNFATLTLNVADEAEIWINGQKRGTGSVTGDFDAGTLIIETRKANHRPVQRSVTVEIGQSRTITLDPPMPIYGSINISSSPQNADVEIDGQSIGKTPCVEPRLIIGQHTVTIRKDGYNTDTELVEIEEGKRMDLNVTLSKGIEITISTNGEGDKILIDGKPVGTAPVHLAVSYGKHTVSAVNGNKTAVKEIDVQKGGTDNFYLVLKRGKSAASKSASKDTAKDESKKTSKAAGKAASELTSAPKTEKSYMYATLNTSVSQYGYHSFGVTFGIMNKIGVFVSANSNFNIKGLTTEYECGSDKLVNGNYPNYTGDIRYGSLSLMAGMSAKVLGGLAVRVGAGYGLRNELYDTYSGLQVKDSTTSIKGLDASLGAQCSLHKIMLSLDCVTTNFKMFETRIGIGYRF